MGAEADEVETRARELGWAPKEEFRGDPEKWIDAETFVRKGEEIMPLLKANNKRLEKELHETKERLTKNEELLKNSQDALEALKEFQTDITLHNAKTQERELTEAIREEDDDDKKEELRDQRREVRETIKQVEGAKTTAKAAPKSNGEGTVDYRQNPEWQAWRQENPWFLTDKRRTAVALAVAEELKTAEPGLKGRELLDRVSAEVLDTFDGGRREAPNKVEGGGHGGSRGTGGKKSYADLPQEAKDACERQAQRLVGPGRAFKSAQDWRTHYTTKYYAE